MSSSLLLFRVRVGAAECQIRWAAKIVARRKALALAWLAVGTMFLGCRDHPDALPPRREPAADHSKLGIPVTWVLDGDSVLPITYLKELRVNPEMTLTEIQKQQLSRLIAKAHDDSIKRYKQSYFLPADTPLGRLIQKNYPAAPRREGGQFYLGDLTTYLNPETER